MKNSIKFSLVLASRGRVKILSDFLKSLKENTKELDQIEVLIGIDNDDLETCNASKEIEKEYKFACFFKRERSVNLNNDYLNWLTGFSKGSYIIACNDDIVVKTKDWDEIALKVLDEYLKDKPDRVVYGYLEDGLLDRQKMDYSCFPLVSRETIEALGWLMPPEFANWDADVVLWKSLYKVGRTCKIPVFFEHFSYHSGKRERDEISLNIQKNYVKSGVFHWKYDNEKNISRLVDCINKKSNILIGKNNKIFSLLVYTRENVESLFDFIESVNNTIKNKDSVEIIVAYNPDDKKTISLIPELNKKFYPLCRFYGKNKSDVLDGNYFNWLYRFVNGNLISICDDDCLFKTKDWDEKLLSETNCFLNNKKTKAACVSINSEVYFKTREAIQLTDSKIVNPEIPFNNYRNYNKKTFSSLDLFFEIKDIEIVKRFVNG